MTINFRVFILLYLMLLGAFSSSSIHARESVILDNRNISESLGHYLEYIEDKEGLLSFNKVRELPTIDSDEGGLGWKAVNGNNTVLSFRSLNNSLLLKKNAFGII